MTENKNILVIGLGSMGYGIAKSLIRTGYKVYGQDKNPDQQKKFFQDGGFVDEVPYDQLEAVVIVVLNEKQTREIIFGEEGISNKLKNNTLIMVCTTVSPDFASSPFGFRCMVLRRYSGMQRAIAIRWHHITPLRGVLQ